MQLTWGFYPWGSKKWAQAIAETLGATWGSFYWGTKAWLAIAAPYYVPGPPAPPQFVIPPEALDPRTPLMSLQASGNFSGYFIFKIQRIKTPTGYDSKIPRQIIQPYYVPPDTKTPCKLFLRKAFRQAVAAWQALPAIDKTPFNKHVAHYGLVMSPYNLFLSKYMRAQIASPENPCAPHRRRDTKRLRRRPGRV